MQSTNSQRGGVGGDGAVTRVLSTWLGHRRFPIALVIVAVVLVLPSLWTGLVADDYSHRIRLLGSSGFPALSGSPLKLFTSADDSSQLTRRLMEIGCWPWWTLPELRVSFFRPIAVATHWLDYRLWPNQPVLMHAQSLAWFAGLVAATTFLYRRFMVPAWLAGLAALLYAIDDARGMPVGLLANRNALIATFFGVLALIAHDRWRRDVWRIGAVAAPLLFAASLLSAEIGLGTLAYVFAHAVFLDRGTWRQRVFVLAPYGIIMLVWRLSYTHLGYGVYGMDVYLDPVTEPWRYAVAVLERAPMLLTGQFLLPPSDTYIPALVMGMTRLYCLASLTVLIVVGVVMIPTLRWDPQARFWALGMTLALLPSCATFPADRMLPFVGLGAFALLARFLRAVFWRDEFRRARGYGRLRRWPVTALGVVCVIVHGFVAPVGLAFRSRMPLGPSSLFDKLTVNVSMGEAQQTVVIVTAPIPIFAGYLPMRCAVEGLPVPAHIRVLAPHFPSPATVRRLDMRTLAIRPAGGFLASPADRVARSMDHPMSLGQRVELPGMTAKVTALTEDGRPAEATFRFAVPLEHSSLRWLTWADGDFAPFTPPDVGGSVEIPAGEPALRR